MTDAFWWVVIISIASYVAGLLDGRVSERELQRRYHDEIDTRRSLVTKEADR